MEEDDPWVIYGKYFGYPECCIRYFCELKHLELGVEWWGFKPDWTFGTGYVPCDKCQGRSEEDIMAEMNRRRMSRKQFPITDDADMSYIVEMVKACQICQERLTKDGRDDLLKSKKLLDVQDQMVLLSEVFDEHSFSQDEMVELESCGFYVEMHEGFYRWIHRIES